MALTYGTVQGVATMAADAVTPIQTARIVFYHDSVNNYDTSAHGKLLAVAALISASRRDGKTITLLGVSSFASQAATNASTGTILALSTVAISGADVTYDVVGSDYATEITNGVPCPAQDYPFGIDVYFTAA